MTRAEREAERDVELEVIREVSARNDELLRVIRLVYDALGQVLGGEGSK